MLSTQWLGERTAFHITQDSCLCLKQVVSKAGKASEGLHPEQAVAWAYSFRMLPPCRNGTCLVRKQIMKGKATKESRHRLSVYREELEWLWCEDGIVLTQQSAECCLKSCKQPDFEEVWKHEHCFCTIWNAFKQNRTNSSYCLSTTELETANFEQQVASQKMRSI